MQVITFVLSVSVPSLCHNGNHYDPEYGLLPEDFLHFPNLEAIKSFFRNDSDPSSQQLLQTFENDCLYMDDPGIPKGRRKPFIVIEGNHRTSRDVVGMKLARRLNGRYLNNLAPCLHEYFRKLQTGTIRRRVFYLLSVYASVFNAKVHLNLNRAVVLNGYWWEQVTFSLLQALKGGPFPPVTSHVFQYPPDLLQPDLIVYVDQPAMPSVLKNRSLEMYQMLSQRHPVMIQQVKKVFRVAIDNVYQHVRETLSETRDFRFKADPYYENY